MTLFEAGIALTAFAAEDVGSEFERLTTLGVKSKTTPTEM